MGYSLMLFILLGLLRGFFGFSTGDSSRNGGFARIRVCRIFI